MLESELYWRSISRFYSGLYVQFHVLKKNAIIHLQCEDEAEKLEKESN